MADTTAPSAVITINGVSYTWKELIPWIALGIAGIALLKG